MGVVGVSLCGEEGLCLCKVIRETDGRFHVEFEFKSLPPEALLDGNCSLKRALESTFLLSRCPAVVAVPHPGFNPTLRCMQQNMVIDALESLPGVVVLQVRLIDRLDGCEAVTGRHIRAEAMEVVAGGDWRLRAAALEFGTPLNEELFGLETQAMREEADQLLRDPTRCSNAPAALAAYTAVSSQPGALVFAADALWNAVCEARHCVSTGFKRSHDPGAFIHSDSYWGYEERGDSSDHHHHAGQLGQGEDGGGLGVEEQEQEEEGEEAAAAGGRRLRRQVVLVQEAVGGQQEGCRLRKRRCWRHEVRMSA